MSGHTVAGLLVLTAVTVICLVVGLYAQLVHDPRRWHRTPVTDEQPHTRTAGVHLSTRQLYYPATDEAQVFPFRPPMQRSAPVDLTAKDTAS